MRYLQLINALKPLSKNQNDKCVKEFIATGKSINGNECACGNQRCETLYEVKNTETGLTTFVGSKCINHFFNEDCKTKVSKIINKKNRLKKNNGYYCLDCGYVKCRCEEPSTHCAICRKLVCKCPCKHCGISHKDSCLDVVLPKGLYSGKTIGELQESREGYSYLKFISENKYMGFNPSLMDQLTIKFTEKALMSRIHDVRYCYYCGEDSTRISPVDEDRWICDGHDV